MKIALLGYGKMGQAIEHLAIAAGHEIVLTINSSNPDDLTAEQLRKADIAIEFSRPELAWRHVEACLQADLPVVCGTTGWHELLPRARALAEERQQAFLYAANFSLGVNIFFALNRYLAERMSQWGDYQPSIREIHHTRKLDAPSGTAIHLVHDLLDRLPHKDHWSAHTPFAATSIPIFSERIGDVPGTHEVIFSSAIDTITIRHEAHSREGFAKGALLAASWIIEHRARGPLSMEDILG